MLRVEPRRWRMVLQTTLLFGIVGAFIVVRTVRPSIESQGALLAGFAVGALAGALFGFVLLYYFARIDTLGFEVAKLQPHALVMLAMKDRDLAASLSAVLRRTPRVTQFTTVAFDRDGLSLWKGVRVPERVALIPTKSIIAVRLGDSVSPGWRAPVQHRLSVHIQLSESAKQLRFAVSSISPLGTAVAASEGDLAELVRKATDALGVLPPANRVTTGTMGANTLQPGVTAWAAARWLRRLATAVPVLGGLVVVAALSPLFSGGRVAVWAVFILIPLQAAYLLGVYVSARATKRERAAGYTTLNRVELDLPQLHPRTGAVLREASALPLSEQRFKDLVQ